MQRKMNLCTRIKPRNKAQPPAPYEGGRVLGRRRPGRTTRSGQSVVAGVLRCVEEAEA